MSTKYKNSSDVPIYVIVARLKELSDAITGGRESQSREFTMRIPAECDRDADLVISEAANRIEQLRAANRDLQAWFDDARSTAEQLQARVAELEGALRYLREPWDLSQIIGADARRRVEAADAALSGEISKAFILRKQSDAVGSLRFPVMMRKMWSGSEVQGWLDDQSKLFRDEADAAEVNCDR